MPAGRGGPKPGAPAGGPPQAARRLEQDAYKWKSTEVMAQVMKHHCGCRTCRVCGRRRGWETRELLQRSEILGLFKAPYLLTLTIDPKKFNSPESAHDSVTNGGFVRRLLRLLGIRTWVWVLEFQKSGWPHWHILVDLSERGRLTRAELRRAWRLWRDKWGLGGLDLQERKRFDQAEHAVNYITKYLTKPAEHYPAWFLNGKRRRLCQASRMVGPLTRGRTRPRPEGTVRRKRQDARTLAERMAACGTSSKVFLREVDLTTGEATCMYVGGIEASIEDLGVLGIARVIPARIGLVAEKVQAWGKEIIRLTFDEPMEDLRGRVTELGEWLRTNCLGEFREKYLRQRLAEILGMVLDG